MLILAVTIICIISITVEVVLFTLYCCTGISYLLLAFAIMFLAITGMGIWLILSGTTPLCVRKLRGVCLIPVPAQHVEEDPIQNV